MAPHLIVRDVAKRFGELQVLDGINLTVAAGETLALLGPSGSGKTTLLRCVGGFETIDGGAIEIGGQPVHEMSAAKRGVGMVFQSYALFPHMTVEQNIRFGLDSQKWESRRKSQRVQEVLELVDLRGFGERKVHQVSGGQQQRVALARALAPQPSILLLDEPLSNLDPTLRERTRAELRENLAAIGMTTLLVTHEQDEAFELGDRVALLHEGNLQQVGVARELYEAPENRFVAGFMGRSGFFGGVCVGVEEGRTIVKVSFGGLGSLEMKVRSGSALEEGAPVEVAVRPEMLRLSTSGVGPCRVQRCRYFGATQLLHLVAESKDSRAVLVEAEGSSDFDEQVFFEQRIEAPLPTAFAR